MTKLTLSRKGQPDWTIRLPVTRYRAGQPNRLRHLPAGNGTLPSSTPAPRYLLDQDKTGEHELREDGTSIRVITP